MLIPVQDSLNGCSSYVIGDESTGLGIVLDPLEAVGEEAYLLTLADAGLKVQMVVESHVHADHRSLAVRLARALGVPLGLHHAAPAAYPFAPLHHGERIELGQVSVEVWETPGHTPDSLSFVVTDRSRGAEPWVALTGDALFVGDVGRPDLATEDEAGARHAACDLFGTLHDKLLRLPDAVEIYPAHYGASSCGGLFLNKKPSSTIGFERRFNRLVQITDIDDFVDTVLALRKPSPAEAASIRRDNLGLGAAPLGQAAV